MIDEHIAAREVERLAVLRKFPDTAAALEELTVAVQQAASEDHARRVITSFTQHEDFCPSPKQIREALWNSRPAAREAEPIVDPVCKCCAGWGLAGPPRSKTYCACPVGQSLKREVTTWTNGEQGLHTPESYLEMFNAPQLVAPRRPVQAHPSWLGREGRKRTALRTS
jgi:hypothetical protein